MAWQFIGTSDDNEPFSIDEIDVWKHLWTRADEKAMVTDPQSGERLEFSVFEVLAQGQTIRFAAGQFGNGARGFYSPD